VGAILTQSSVPQLMFAGPGKPAGATASNYPSRHFTCSDDVRVAYFASLSSRTSRATVSHSRAPRTVLDDRGRENKRERKRKKRGDSHEKRASEITRYAHGHTKHVQHVALITTDCPVHLPFRRYRGAAGTDRRGKPPVILTWRTLAVARRATAHASNEARREI